MKQRDQLFDVIRSECSMIDTTVNRDPDAHSLKTWTFGGTDGYLVHATGASVTADSSISLIQRYCEKLPTAKYECFPGQSLFLNLLNCMYIYLIPYCIWLPHTLGVLLQSQLFSSHVLKAFTSAS